MNRARVLVLLAALGFGCSETTRFALRPPVVRVDDERPFARAPASETGSDAIDAMVLRPLSHALTFESVDEAHDVNSLDEVPDSSWFTNRTVTAEQVARGPCSDAGPVPPFTITSTKVGGVTSGFVARDARGQKYVLKLDELARYGQPEISTAADAVVSRLYWAIGFNAPCNDTVYVRPRELILGADAKEVLSTGRRKALTAARVAEILQVGTRAGGAIRFTASRFIDGEDVGTWRPEGVRPDDPNDVIPHEDRRELRGEFFLAGWTAHWDTRRANTFDAFVRAGRGGYVLHYFLDFSDALGGTITHTKWNEPRSGLESVSSVQTIAVDAVGFGFVRRPWDDVKIDPRFPDLGYLDVEHFDPLAFSAQTPVVRWAHAQPQDLAWMARKIARIDEGDVRAAVRAARLSHPREERRLVEILMGRRERILRTSFTRISPLADVTVNGDIVCATDLARTTRVASAPTSYAAAFRRGRRLEFAPVAPRLERTGEGVCATLPHFAPAGAPPSSSARYAILDLVRFEGRARTRLRVHLYDLGARYALVGIERP